MLMIMNQLEYWVGRRCSRVVEKNQERNIQLGHDSGRRYCWAPQQDLLPVFAVLGGYMSQNENSQRHELLTITVTRTTSCFFHESAFNVLYL